MPMPQPATCITPACPTEKPEASGNIMMAAKPMRTPAIEVMAEVRICAGFGDPVDVDDGEVAEEEHGERHDDGGDLPEHLPDHGRGGSGRGRRRSADREHALQHLPRPVVAGIERRPADVEGCSCPSTERESRVDEEKERQRSPGQGNDGGWSWAASSADGSRMTESCANRVARSTEKRRRPEGPPARKSGGGRITARDLGSARDRGDERRG